MSYNHIKIGHTATRCQMITEDLIRAFAEVTGDKNPLHLDEAFAKKTLFKGRIAHGMIAASLISALLAKEFPGGIYLSQTLQWTKPVRIGDRIEAKIEVLKKSDAKKELELRTTCTNQKGEEVLNGEARIRVME